MRGWMVLALTLGCGTCGDERTEGTGEVEEIEDESTESSQAANAAVDPPATVQPPEPRPKPPALTPEQLAAVREAQADLREGRRLGRSGLWDQAVPKLRESIEHSDSARARCELGWALFQTAQLDEAREELERGAAMLSRRRHREGERNTLGACLYNLGRATEATDPAAAAAHYRASLEVRPNDTVEARLARLGVPPPPPPSCEPRVCQGPFPTGAEALASAGLDDDSEGVIAFDDATETSLYRGETLLAFVPFEPGWFVCELGPSMSHGQVYGEIAMAQWVAGGEPEVTFEVNGFDAGHEEGINNAMGEVWRHFVGRRGDEAVVYGSLLTLDYYDDGMLVDCDCQEDEWENPGCCEIEDISRSTWTRIAYADSGRLRLTHGESRAGEDQQHETEVVALEELGCRPDRSGDDWPVCRSPEPPLPSAAIAVPEGHRQEGSMTGFKRWQSTVLTLVALAAVGCGDDDSLFHQSNDTNRAIEQEYCRCEPDPAVCRAEVAEDFTSASDEIELDCLAASYGPYASSLGANFQCELQAQSDFRACVAGATCTDVGFEACETQFDAAREACPIADEGTLDMFFDAADACYADRFVGPPEGDCPNRTVSGTGPVLSISTIGRGHDVDLECGGSDAPDVTVAWTAPSTGTFGISTLGSDYDTLIGVLSSCGGEELACNDDGGEDLTSYLELSATAGTQYIIVLSGFSDDGGNARLSITAL